MTQKGTNRLNFIVITKLLSIGHLVVIDVRGRKMLT
jgi:hypothetical protein